MTLSRLPDGRSVIRLEENSAHIGQMVYSPIWCHEGVPAWTVDELIALEHTLWGHSISSGEQPHYTKGVITEILDGHNPECYVDCNQCARVARFNVPDGEDSGWVAPITELWVLA